MTDFRTVRVLRFVLPVVLALSTASIGTARAADADADLGSSSVQVSLAGLDLSSRNDQAIARHRIAVAAVRACDAPSPGDLPSSAAFDSCREQATATAEATLIQRIALAGSDYRVAEGGR